jgi:hypothetical protein
VGVPVEVLAGAVVAHRRSGVGVAGGDPDATRSTPASSMVVMNVCRIRAMVTPACSGSRRSRRVAQCRSIRVPREVRRIGPTVAPYGRSSDGWTGRGWQRNQHDLVALAVDPQDAVAVFLTEVVDVAAGRGLRGHGGSPHVSGTRCETGEATGC